MGAWTCDVCGQVLGDAAAAGRHEKATGHRDMSVEMYVRPLLRGFEA